MLNGIDVEGEGNKAEVEVGVVMEVEAGVELKTSARGSLNLYAQKNSIIEPIMNSSSTGGFPDPYGNSLTSDTPTASRYSSKACNFLA
jgi:hypothetical protein